jgi:2,3-bisphosphoglycerate-dependent phosphoglycerate mutase
MSAAPIVYLIRHGETADNARRVLQMPGVPLSERGLEQARRLGARLAGAGIARILVSDYERARMTARALAEATGAPLHEDPLLRERHFGELRGRAYASLGFDPFAPGYVPPGGESIPVFATRVARAFDAIRTHAANAGGPLAVVTHGLVCRDLVANHLTLSPALAAAPPDPYRWTNTCVTEVDPSTWTVRLLACTAHLEDVRDVAPA